MVQPLSRRHFLGLSACSLATAGLAPLLGVTGTARAQLPPPVPGMDAPGAVLLNYNENPLGPFPEAREAAVQAMDHAHRYLFGLQHEFTALFAEKHGVDPRHVAAYCGSGVALDAAALAFTGPQAALVTADPTFETLAQMASAHGARVVRVPLRSDGAHDVEAMAAAAAKNGAGLVYVCNPNNPTGSTTPRAGLDWLLAHKPAGAIVLADEAYIHYSDEADLLDLVRDGREDLVVLRTFSKIYGMAGLRLGAAVAHQSLLRKLVLQGVNSLPVPAIAAGMASLQHPGHLATRKADNRRLRQETVDWLATRGHACLPSQANCFMVDVHGDGRTFGAAMAKHGVFVGRSWPSMPRHVRVTVGTAEEMARFRETFEKVMAGQP